MRSAPARCASAALASLVTSTEGHRRCGWRSQLRCIARHAAPAAQRASGGLGEANGQGRATNGENAEVGRATPGAALTSSEKRSTTPPLASASNAVIGPAATPVGWCRGREFDARAAGPTCGLRVPCGGGECLAALRSGLAGEGGLLARSVHSRQWRTRSKGRSGGSAARSRRDPSREPPLLYRAGRGQRGWDCRPRRARELPHSAQEVKDISVGQRGPGRGGAAGCGGR